MWGEDGRADSQARKRAPVAIAAPKPLPPGHAESYNPPPEYVPTALERSQWELMEPEERPYAYVPTLHGAMRDVPAYRPFLRERFERCLDLYMIPRSVKKKQSVDPEALIPQLPKPKDLRPFPTRECLQYIGHTDIVRSISFSPCGQWLASGSSDRSVRVWEVDTGRCFRQWVFRDVVSRVAWSPNRELPVLAVLVGPRLVLLHTHTGCPRESQAVEALFASTPAVPASTEGKVLRSVDASWRTTHDVPQEEALTEAQQAQALADQEDGAPPPVPLEAEVAPPVSAEHQGRRRWRRLTITLGKTGMDVAWHRKGDYLASISQRPDAQAVLVHRVSRQQSQAPFSQGKGKPQRIMFHPLRPLLLLASLRHVRLYDLQKQKMIKKLQTPARWLSSITVHPSGDHVLVGSYDRRVMWFDLDTGSKPYKTLKYHQKAVRQVAMHARYPLFASASDDGRLHVFHATVYDDLMTPPQLVPVKVLSAQAPRGGLGVLDAAWHPSQPWLASAGADAVIRLFS